MNDRNTQSHIQRLCYNLTTDGTQTITDLLEHSLEAFFQFLFLQSLWHFCCPEQLTHRDDHLTRPDQHPICPFFLQTKALNLWHASPTFIVQGMLHFASGIPVHANTISTSVEASSHAAIAAHKLFVLIIQSLKSILLSGTHLYRWVNWGKVGWTKLP